MICKSHVGNPNHVHTRFNSVTETRRRKFTGAAFEPCPIELGNFDNDIISYCSEGKIHKAIILIFDVVGKGIAHSLKLYAHLFKACIRLNALTEGRHVHDVLVESGYDANIFLENTLVDMYAKCGSLSDASHVFENMRKHNLFSYTAIISAYSMHGESEKAIGAFERMQSTGVMPDKFVFTLVIKACAISRSLADGRNAHSFFIVSGLEPDTIVVCTLIDMYSKCSAASDARGVFDNTDERNVIVWTSMIACHTDEGDKGGAFQLFQQMCLEGVRPNDITCLMILKSCFSQASLLDGKKMHAFILANQGMDVAMGNTLVDMYANCSSITDARRVFDEMEDQDVVSWNVMVRGYAQVGLLHEAALLFEEMQHQGVAPNEITIVAILNGCAQWSDVVLGKLIHACTVEKGSERSTMLHGSLVDMYAKSGCIKDAQKVFDGVDNAGVISWTALIAGYTKVNLGKEALSVFVEMKQKGVKPDHIAFVSSLNACASMGALEIGKKIHLELKKIGLHGNTLVRNALIDMYTKCGSLELAGKVFDSEGERDVVSWNTIISGYAHQGLGKQALSYFEEMLEEGQKPDATTFLAVLTACRHGGLVAQGRRYFDSMSQEHGITPTTDHYACVVDLLCRVGHVDEAEAFILKMGVEPDALLWMCLLGGCRCRGDIEIARRAYRHIKLLSPNLPGAYVAYSNLLALAGMWEERTEVKMEMEILGLEREDSYTWIEVEDEVHKFSASDRSHAQEKEIEAELERLAIAMKEAGYKPVLCSVFNSIAEDEKEEVLLCDHSEKYAVAFGLIRTPSERPIRITKNLRLCGDCHAAIKMISRIKHREIFSRDANRFHHFKYGVCSCGDYW